MSEVYGLFVGPKLKLARARQHLDSLRERINEFVSLYPFNIYFYSYPNRSPTFICGMIAPVPPEVSLAYGDTVHCLRASLDLLANDVVKLNGGSTKGVYFPFAASEDLLPDQIKQKKFDRAGDQAVEILKSLKPYRGGDEVLRGMHDLDIQDKHQMILPTLPTFKIPHVKLGWGIEGTGVHLRDVRLGPDTHFGIPALPRTVEIGGTIEVEINFSQDAPDIFQRRELFATISDLFEKVAQIIDQFETSLKGSSAPVPPLRFEPASGLNDRPKFLVKQYGGADQHLLSDVYAKFGEPGKLIYGLGPVGAAGGFEVVLTDPPPPAPGSGF